VAEVFGLLFWKRCSALEWEIHEAMEGKNTLPKFNSSPLKKDGWNPTFLLGWYIFRGYVKFPGSRFCRSASIFFKVV